MSRLQFGDILDRRFGAIWLLVLVLLLYGWLNPLRIGHWVLIVVFGALVIASRASRSLAVAVWPAAIFGFAYDTMRLLLARSYNMAPSVFVHDLETWGFGWVSPTPGDLGPVDLFVKHHSIFIDLAAALWYSTHVPSVILFGLYLWWRTFRGREPTELRVDKYFWGFLIFNLLGFLCWALFPVAPPWYVEAHGLVAPDTLGLGHPIWGSPAGLGRVDIWLGTPHFADLYRNSTYVFGAMPSLHAAAPIWVALWTRKRPIRALAWCYALAMCFFAVYLTHHYIVDVLAGGLLAWALFLLLEKTRVGDWILSINRWLRGWLDDLFGRPVVFSEAILSDTAEPPGAVEKPADKANTSDE